MTRLMKQIHVIVFIGIAALLITIIGINMYCYIGIFRMNEMVSILFTTGMLLVYSFFTKSNTYKHRRVLIISIVLCMVIVLVFLIKKPDYTVKQSISYIRETSEILDVRQDEKVRTVGFTPKFSFFIASGYVLIGVLDGKEIEIIFNPVNGEYDINRTAQ